MKKWWKPRGLAALTFILIFCVIPVRTHAVALGPLTVESQTSARSVSLLSAFSSATYLPPATIIEICLILSGAAALGAWIVRKR